MKKLFKEIMVLGIGCVLSLSSVTVGFASELSTPQEFYGTTHNGIDIDGLYTPIPVLTLNWNSVSEADGYEVWCRDMTEGNDFYSDWYISQNVSVTTAEEWIIDGYLQVKVRAYGSNGYSDYTDTITFLGGEGITNGPTSHSEIFNTGWVQDNSGWWYQRTDGSYPVSQWELIDSLWYHFNDFGYMQTGWIQDNGNWYYLDETGKMLSNVIVDTYRLDENGVWVDNISTVSNNMYDMYKSILYENFPTNSLRGESLFALFDINKDGTKELLLKYGGGAYMGSNVYYFKNGEIIKSEEIFGISGYINAEKAITTYSSHTSQIYQGKDILGNEGLTEIDSLGWNAFVSDEKDIKYTHNNNSITKKEYETLEKEYEKATPITFYEVSEENIDKYVK